MGISLNRRKLLQGAAGAAALAATPAALAQLQIEITGVGANQIPIAIPPLAGTDATKINLSQVIASDLERTGMFRLIEADQEASLIESARPNLMAWQEKEANMLVTGSIVRQVNGKYDVRYRLFDTVKGGGAVDERSYIASEVQLRMTAHRIADRIFDKLTGMGALFASRLAYVVQYSEKSYELIVAESDGANPRAALRSRESIISPAWSPDGRHVAYVSFEAQKPVVYIHTIATGKRRVVANFLGNNSAPAFSPDGKKLAVALSRDGFTQIYIINVDGSGLKRFTRSYAIDTEPVFSADGRYLYFTSDRGGSAQIYRQALHGGEAERLTFVSDYAVSPSLNPSGTQMTYITRISGEYRVALLDLSTGQETILSKTSMDESPCFSPNGRMIVYATEEKGRGVLATVSSDGAVSSFLTGPRGDIREPTWGPLLGE